MVTLGMILTAACTVVCCVAVLVMDWNKHSTVELGQWAGMSIVSALMFCLFIVVAWFC